MDGVHILMDRCEASMANEYTSHKMKQTARAFNVVVNNRRKILHCSDGFPCRFNDKSLLMSRGGGNCNSNYHLLQLIAIIDP